jgi:hypothetical protein
MDYDVRPGQYRAVLLGGVGAVGDQRARGAAPVQRVEQCRGCSATPVVGAGDSGVVASARQRVVRSGFGVSPSHGEVVSVLPRVLLPGSTVIGDGTSVGSDTAGQALRETSESAGGDLVGELSGRSERRDP